MNQPNLQISYSRDTLLHHLCQTKPQVEGQELCTHPLIGHPYPIADLPMYAEDKEYPYYTPATLIIEYTQSDVSYMMCSLNTSIPIFSSSHAGNGQSLVIKTEPLTVLDQVEFHYHATRKTPEKDLIVPYSKSSVVIHFLGWTIHFEGKGPAEEQKVDIPAGNTLRINIELDTPHSDLYFSLWDSKGPTAMPLSNPLLIENESVFTIETNPIESKPKNTLYLGIGESENAKPYRWIPTPLAIEINEAGMVRGITPQRQNPTLAIKIKPPLDPIPYGANGQVVLQEPASGYRYQLHKATTGKPMGKAVEVKRKRKSITLSTGPLKKTTDFQILATDLKTGEEGWWEEPVRIRVKAKPRKSK